MNAIIYNTYNRVQEQMVRGYFTDLGLSIRALFDHESRRALGLRNLRSRRNIWNQYIGESAARMNIVPCNLRPAWSLQVSDIRQAMMTLRDSWGRLLHSAGYDTV